jgi:tetratricopeptide (TPR) repeat protein
VQQRYDDAASATEKALKLNDKNYLVWRNLGEDYSWAKQPDQAMAARKRELQILEASSPLHPQDAQLISEMATLYADNREREKAISGMQKALALAPADANVLLNAAIIQETLGNRSEAVRYAQESIAKGNTIDDIKRNFALRGILTDPKFHIAAKQ